MSLFHELLWDLDHSAWNEYDLPGLKLVEIQFLCQCLGAPKSGTKEKIIIRLLAVRQVRIKLSKYACDFDGAMRLVSDFQKEPLKWMAKEAGVWRSGNKRQLAVCLLQWRDRARVSGKKFLDQAFAEAAKAPRQLTLDL